MFSMREFLRHQHFLASHGSWTDHTDTLLQYCDDLIDDSVFRACLTAQNRQFASTIVVCGRPECCEQFIPSPSQRAALRNGQRVYHSLYCKKAVSGKHRPTGV